MLAGPVTFLALLSQTALPPQRIGEDDPATTRSRQTMAVLAVEDARAPTARDLSLLIASASSSNPRIQIAAIRALGRLERRDVVTDLLKYLRAPAAATRAEAAFAIAQGMRGNDPSGAQVDIVLQALLSAADDEKSAATLGEIARSLGRLPYERAEQVQRADALLCQVLSLSNELDVERRTQGAALPALRGAVAGAELLGRLHGKVSSASEELTILLRRLVTGQTTINSKDRPPPQEALQALISVRGVDEDTLRISLASDHESVRRLALTSLASGSSTITGTDRADHLRRLLNDRSELVRYEALRGYVRTQARTEGCNPIMERVADPSLHVVLAAIDAMGDACAGDENAVNRATGEARTPPNSGNWQREAHAMVALAKLSKERAAIALHSHSRHSVWQVRMYAARAAGILGDAATLERLAADDNDNVRESALPPLRRIMGSGAAPHLLAALGRRDYQLLRTAAREMSGLPASTAMTSALLDALVRVTAEKRDTSRDVRLAFLERLQEFGVAEHVPRLVPLLEDFDPKVAAAAAGALAASTGATYGIDPRPLPRPPPPTAAEMGYLMAFNPVLVMATGGDIELSLDVDRAPLTSARFLRLARAHYFDGLTFHRVVPGFVIQGGSPGANEYMGDGPYLRDEISTRTHGVGTMGISTRGRDTGDAQIFLNLVDNPRLDFEYTVFGNVERRSLDRMRDVVEGDIISSVRFVRKRSAVPRRIGAGA